MQTIAVNKEDSIRDWSMDLLRILCMLMIVILHMGNHGGMLKAFPISSVNHWLIYFIQYSSIVSVNIFVLISGYFLINHRFKLKRVLSIVSHVWFYSWLIQTVLTLSERFFGTSGEGFTSEELLNSLMPISFKQYWFASAYICLYLLTPILNNFLNKLEQQDYRRILIYLFIITSVWTSLIPLSDPFSLARGFSISWFLFLYTYAGYCRLYGSIQNMKRSKWFLVYLTCVVIMVIAYCVLFFAGMPYNYELTGFFSRYCSVLNFIGSAALFHVFRGFKIKNKWIQKIIVIIAPLTFGVYLIHDNPHMRTIIYDKILRTSSISDNWLAVPIVLLMSVAIFISCAIIEFCRKKLFGLWESSIKYNIMLQKVQNRLSNILNIGANSQK